MASSSNVLPRALRDQILELDRSIDEQQRAENKARAEATLKETQETGLYSTMNFRERYLGGWFGGDHAKVENYRTARRLKDEFNAKADEHAATRSDLDHQAHQALDESLKQTDPTYQALLEPKIQAERAKQAVDRFMESIEEALDSINSAQSMETMDLVSSNKGISLMSTMSNSSARSAVGRVKEDTPAFESAMTAYDDFLKNYKLPAVSADFGEMTDFILDMAFDGGFDFMSIFSLSALNRAEDQMEELQDTVQQVDSFVSGNCDKATRAVAAYRGKVRSLCHANGPS